MIIKYENSKIVWNYVPIYQKQIDAALSIDRHIYRNYCNLLVFPETVVWKEIIWFEETQEISCVLPQSKADVRGDDMVRIFFWLFRDFYWAYGAFIMCDEWHRHIWRGNGSVKFYTSNIIFQISTNQNFGITKSVEKINDFHQSSAF